MEVLQRLLLLCFAALAVSHVSRAIVDEELNRRCQAQSTCADCITESPDCIWCSETDDPPNGERRCNGIDRDTGDNSSTCDNMFIEDPVSMLDGTSNEQFNPLTQVIPQRATVSVRPGSPQEFDVQVRPATDFPIDLYLLMDLSFSMNDDLQNLKTLGNQLADRIAAISNNFTLGFGSFVDKVRASFINLDPRRLVDPCTAGCQAPYSYRHVVSLTADDDLFSDRVNEQVISGNQDFPEGGFDGLLQSIVCTDFIGWRQVSRKILLYISDAGFHFAGDGLLGGVVRPNDGECHMNDAMANPDGTTDYDQFDKLDFPSIGQIAEKLDKFDIIPIFAVVESFQDLYRLLQSELGNRAYLGELDTDSSNVVDLVEQLYNEISTSIVFSPVNVPGVSVTTTIIDCPTERDGVCVDVENGDTVTFRVSVDIVECTPELMDGPREIELRVVGFGTVTVELTALCQCDCDAMDQQEPNSAECTGQGTLVCGTCECNPGYFGDRCQCDDAGTLNVADIECPSGLDGLECSGRGICTCGICECRTDANGEERFYGIACECDNTVCTRGIGNEICSGPSRGECTCDGCQCLLEPTTGQPYAMSDCSCTPNTQTCFDPTNSTDICNGRGVCECGACICQAPYFGEFCELCSGDPICQPRTCAPDGDNARCASCVIDLLDVLNDRDFGFNLFTPEVLLNATLNGSLPDGTFLTQVMIDEMIVAALELPEDFSADCSSAVNASCPQFVVINDTLEMEYEIQNTLSIRCSFGVDCIYPYFVAITEAEVLLPIHIGYPPACPLIISGGSSSSGSDLALPPWAIALILIGILLVIGIIALILLKLLLVILDYIELRKFEKELEKIKYSKNENPLYHSATTDYKNPIYGQ